MSQAGSASGGGGGGGGVLKLNYTSVTTSPYITVSSDEFLGVNTSSIAITIELPNAPAVGRVYIVKDTTGNAATHHITVRSVNGLVNFDASTTFTMNTAYQSAQFLYNGSKYLIF